MPSSPQAPFIGQPGDGLEGLLSFIAAGWGSAQAGGGPGWRGAGALRARPPSRKTTASKVRPFGREVTLDDFMLWCIFHRLSLNRLQNYFLACVPAATPDFVIGNCEASMKTPNVHKFEIKKRGETYFPNQACFWGCNSYVRHARQS